jgi:hypothetical protein
MERKLPMGKPSDYHMPAPEGRTAHPRDMLIREETALDMAPEGVREDLTVDLKEDTVEGVDLLELPVKSRIDNHAS